MLNLILALSSWALAATGPSFDPERVFDAETLPNRCIRRIAMEGRDIDPPKSPVAAPIRVHYQDVYAFRSYKLTHKLDSAPRLTLLSEDASRMVEFFRADDEGEYHYAIAATKYLKTLGLLVPDIDQTMFWDSCPEEVKGLFSDDGKKTRKCWAIVKQVPKGFRLREMDDWCAERYGLHSDEYEACVGPGREAYRQTFELFESALTSPLFRAAVDVHFMQSGLRGTAEPWVEKANRALRIDRLVLTEKGWVLMLL